MKKLSISFILTLAFSHTCLSQDTRQIKIDQLINDLHQRKIFNGAIVAGQNGKIIFSKGFGYANFKDSILFTPSTTCDGGSNAKTFTATCILLLAEEGKLKLNDPVQRFLPDYPYPNTTIANLITHSTGGLPDYDYYFERSPDTTVITNSLNLHTIARLRPTLKYAPGTNFYYDNVGFDLAVLIVEKVSGKTYSEFLKERIFQHTNMNSAFVRPALFADWSNRSTIGYHYRNDSLHLLDIADREGFYGGGNLWFSATDLYHWGESFYYHPVLSKKVIQKIISPVFINGNLSYVRQGAWYRGKTLSAFYYWGNVAGFYSWVYWDKEKKFSIAFVTNTDMPQWARPLLTSALIDIMSGKDFLPLIEPPSAVVDRKKFYQIEGMYNVPGIGSVKIFVRGSQALLKVGNGMEYHMFPLDGRSFYVPGFDPWISFLDLENDKFQKINWHSTNRQTTGVRVNQ